MIPVKVYNDIHAICVNDIRKNLFENIWPLPYGISYNCYIINDEKTALLETVELGSDGNFLSYIDHVLQGRALDYLIINHMEPDHSGEISNVIARYPNIKIVGNKMTFKILRSYMNCDNNIIEIKDGDTLNLGKHNLVFYTTPMVHWPESMVSYDETTQTLFSQDAFGGFGTLDGSIFDDEVNFDFYRDERCRYYTNHVGKSNHFGPKA